MAFSLLLYPSIIFANLANLQKFRLAKAKLALENEDSYTYKKLIKLNIADTIPHIDSLIHWGNYLFTEKEFSKAFRAYHQVIGRLHTKELLDLKDNSQIKNAIRKVTFPEDEVTQLYLNLADFYYKLLKEKSFSDVHKKRFHHKAEKYYKITREFNYQTFYCTFMLGKLKMRERNEEEAYKIFIKAKEIPSGRDDARKLKDEIDVILAESLFYYHKQDSSQIYLRGIYQNQGTTASSRDYAKYYFDSLEKDYFSTTLSYLISQKYNLHELTDSQRENVQSDAFKNEYGVDKGILNTFNLQSFLNKKLKNRWSILANLNLSAENSAQDSAKRADRRYLSAGIDFKKFTHNQSLYKITYNYNTLWSKPAKETPLERNDDSHTFRPEYTYTLRSGAMTWGGIYSFIKESTERKAALGLSWSYQRHNRSRWWSPTYSFEFIREAEILNLPTSSIFSASLSNPSTVTEYWTLFSALDFKRNVNSLNALDFFQYEISFAAQREMQFLNNFYFDLYFRQGNKSYSNNEDITLLEIGAGCTYNF
jgi:hypothetical protein